MAGTRTVYRGSKGRFAGASKGKAETVKSGGFAHPGFRARVIESRRAKAQSGTQVAPSAAKKGGRGAFPLGTRRRAVAKGVLNPISSARSASVTANAQRRSGNSARIRSDLKKGAIITAVGITTAGVGGHLAKQGNIGGGLVAIGGGTMVARVGGSYLGHATGGAINRKVASNRRAMNAARPKIAAGSRVKR